VKPEGLSAVQCAMLPVAGLTALQALRDAGNVKEKNEVLVIGASGIHAPVPCSPQSSSLLPQLFLQLSFFLSPSLPAMRRSLQSSAVPHETCQVGVVILGRWVWSHGSVSGKGIRRFCYCHLLAKESGVRQVSGS
jgi:hypothetical protein